MLLADDDTVYNREPFLHFVHVASLYNTLSLGAL